MHGSGLGGNQSIEEGGIIIFAFGLWMFDRITCLAASCMNENGVKEEKRKKKKEWIVCEFLL